MIIVGIDDTDTRDSRGTNQLAKAMARELADQYLCHRITRHQLLDDPRVRYTSKNGSASLILELRDRSRASAPLYDLADAFRRLMQADFIPGSDPGLCVADHVDREVMEFGRRCQHEVVDRSQACELAARHGVILEGLGGTCDGVIGALAAVGLAAADNDGRVVQWQHWPDDLSGWQGVEEIERRGIEVRMHGTLDRVRAGSVDVGKRLRPNWRAGTCVLYVTRDDSQSAPAGSWRAIRKP